MQADQTTINDLSIFHADEEQSVFHHINFTRTVGGREWLRFFLSKPLQTLKQIQETQQTIQQIIDILPRWPQSVTNGTIMVIEKFYETALEEIPPNPNAVSSLSYRFLNSSDYSIIKYSATHFTALVKGLQEIVHLLMLENMSSVLEEMLERIRRLLNRPAVKEVLQTNANKKLSLSEVLAFGHFVRRNFKSESQELIEIYSKLDAYYSMAVACKNYNFIFPVFTQTAEPAFVAQQLYHPLLPTPVAYNTGLMPESNFLFLTGANMAGKSTFIKAVGVAAYLAHIGMGVPAQSMTLTVFDGLLSNIQVVDNIIKGESYFFNEVQRIKKTIEKISDGKKWLILIDELFKGTNVQDAMKCSSVVIEGLRKMNNAIFILSTHLYEIGESLQQFSNIQFHYFETEVKNDQLLFSYLLKEGISNDRLGYLILKREGVVDILNKL